MKKVTIYFKSGNKLIFKCKNFEFNYDKTSDKRKIEIEGANIDSWMIDAQEMESYTVKQCLW